MSSRQGSILRDELKDLDAAIEQCSTALDSYFMDAATVTESRLPIALQPFRVITKILTDRGDFKTLERQYRLMIARLEGGPHVALQATLFESLAEVYRLLGHDTAAESAFEQAKQLRGAAPVT